MLQTPESPEDNTASVQGDETTYFEVGLLPPTHPRDFEESSKYRKAADSAKGAGKTVKRKTIKRSEQQSILDGLFAISQMQESGELDYLGKKRRRRQIIVMWCEKCGSSENVHISDTKVPFTCQLCKESHSKPEDQGKRLPNLIPLGKLNNSKPKTSSGPSDVSKVTLRPSPPPLVPMPASAKAKLNDHHPKETQHFA